MVADPPPDGNGIAAPVEAVLLGTGNGALAPADVIGVNAGGPPVTIGIGPFEDVEGLGG